MRRALGLAVLASTGLINISLGHLGADKQHDQESDTEAAWPIERMSSSIVDSHFEQRRDLPDHVDSDDIKLSKKESLPSASCEDCLYRSNIGLEAISGNCIRMLMLGNCDLKKLSVAQNLDYLFALDCEDGRCVQRAENSVDKGLEIYAVYPQKEVCKVFDEVCSAPEYHFSGKAHCNQTRCYSLESCTNGECRNLTQGEFREFFNNHMLLGAIGMQIDEHEALPADASTLSDDEKLRSHLQSRGWPKIPLPLKTRSASLLNEPGCGSETCIDDQGRSMRSNADHFFLWDPRQDRYITIAKDARIVIERSIGQLVAVDPQGKVKVSYPGLTLPGISPRPDMTEATVVVHCTDDREVRVDANGRVYRAEQHGPLVRIDEFGHVYSRDRQGRDISFKDNGRLEWSNQNGHRLVIDDTGVREQTGRILASFDNNRVQMREESTDDDSDDHMLLEQTSDCNSFTDDLGRYVSIVDGNIYIDTYNSDWTLVVDENNMITVLDREGRMTEIKMNGQINWFDPVVEHRITIDESEGIRDWDKLIYSFQDHKYPVSRQRDVQPELERLVSKKRAIEENTASRLSSPARITITREHTTFIATETTNQLGHTIYITKEDTPTSTPIRQSSDISHSNLTSTSNHESKNTMASQIIHSKSNEWDRSHVSISGVEIKSTEILWASTSVENDPSATAVSKEGVEIWTIDDNDWIVSDHQERVTLVDSNGDGVGNFLVKKGRERLGLFDKAGNAVIIDVRDLAIVYDEDDDGEIEIASLQGQAHIRLAIRDGVGNRVTSEAQGYFAMTDENGDGVLDFVEVDEMGRLFMEDIDGNQLSVSWKKVALEESSDLNEDGNLDLIFKALDNEGKLHMEAKGRSIMAISWKAFAMVMTWDEFGITTYAYKPIILVDDEDREIVMMEPTMVRDVSQDVLQDVYQEVIARRTEDKIEDKHSYAIADDVDDKDLGREMIKRSNECQEEDYDESDDDSNSEVLKRDETCQDEEFDEEDDD
ncbi:MAG: hypothetical protein FE78DRAFT_101256 [Acidomyces sp. 'richmondensis']|nr:MAG: hypothetical protein FE78DRAFT_101256 [Acidomyces sp. 'richmondensis']